MSWLPSLYGVLKVLTKGCTQDVVNFVNSGTVSGFNSRNKPFSLTPHPGRTHQTRYIIGARLDEPHMSEQVYIVHHKLKVT